MTDETRSRRLLAADRLRDRLDYDPQTGVFRWKVSSGKAAKGSIAGCTVHSGYLKIGIEGAPYYAHRLAWLYVYGEWPSFQIDHINGLPSDNRLCNLREATNAENGQNLAITSRNTSGHIGVSWDTGRKKWCADIRLNGVTIHLGRFDRVEDAVKARAKAKERHHAFQPFDRSAVK